MSADHSALVRAVGACLTAEAGRVADELFGQVCLGQYLVSVKRCKRRLCGREHIADAVVRRIFDLIYLVGKLRELSRGHAALIFEHVRGQDQLITVGKVSVDKVIEQSPLKARTHAAVDPEARA